MPTQFPWSHPLLSNYIVYLSGIPHDCTRSNLLEYLSQFGLPLWLSVFYNMHSQVRYAHFIFLDPKAYQSFFALPIHTMGNSVLQVCMWRKSELGEVLEGARNQRKVFLKNVGPKHSETALREYFERFGLIDSIEFPVNHRTQDKKQIAFITYRQIDSAVKALENPVIILAGEKLKIRHYSYKTKLLASGVPSPLSITSQLHQLLGQDLLSSAAMSAGGLKATGGEVRSSLEVVNIGVENPNHGANQVSEDLCSKEEATETAGPTPNDSVDLCSSETSPTEATARSSSRAPNPKQPSHDLSSSTSAGDRIKIIHFDSDLGSSQLTPALPSETPHQLAKKAVVNYFTVAGLI